MKIGFIIAMDEECHEIRTKLNHNSKHTVANQCYSTSTIDDTEVTVWQCGIGKTCATIGATLLINQIHPDYIINLGVAGGLSQYHQISDILLAQEFRYADVDVTPLGYEYGQMAQMPASYHSDQRLLELAKNTSTADYMMSSELIISGDSFFSAAQCKQLQQRFPQFRAIDMEATAIGSSLPSFCNQISIH